MEARGKEGERGMRDEKWGLSPKERSGDRPQVMSKWESAGRARTGRWVGIGKKEGTVPKGKVAGIGYNRGLSPKRREMGMGWR